MTSDEARMVYSEPGLSVYVLDAPKFKTDTITVCFSDALISENIAYNAIFPMVLQAGTRKYPSMREIAKQSAKLYGTVVDAGVMRRGDRQMVYFYAESVRAGQKLFEEASQLLFELIGDPFLVEGAFSNEYVEMEKQNQLSVIEARLNDKASYAMERLVEKMFEGEPFGVPESGDASKVMQITPKSLYDYYKSFINTRPVMVYLTGDIDDEKIEVIKKECNVWLSNRNEVHKIPEDAQKLGRGTLSVTTELFNVTQAKLCLGYVFEGGLSPKERYQAALMSSILGGGLHSLLFQEVREKQGLCYTIYSRLDKYKATIFIASGIKPSDKEKTKALIDIQIARLKNPKEWQEAKEAAIKSIITAVAAMNDSQMSMVDYFIAQQQLNTTDSPMQFLKKMQAVTDLEIVELSSRLRLDTEYFMTCEDSNTINDEHRVHDEPITYEENIANEGGVACQ